MRQIMVVQEIHPEAMKLLRQKATVIVPPNINLPTLIEMGENVQALIVRLTAVTAELLNGLPQLKVVGRHGMGVDNIDIKAANSLGIAVVNTPGVNTITVTEYTIGALLLMARRFITLDKEARSGSYQIRDEVIGTELRGKTLGLIGFGAIGQMVASFALVLGMNVCYYDPYCIESKERVVRIINLKDLLEKSNFVSIHVPLTEETYHLIGEKELGYLQPGTHLINASRGGVVDEDALFKSLSDGNLSSAAIDVMETEPFAKEHPLYKLDNLLITPHIAGITQECLLRMGHSLTEDVLRVLDGEKPKNLVNPQVWRD